jgi:hypothetical protein
MSKKLLFAALLGCSATFSTAHAASSPFDKGTSSVAFTLGSGSAFNDNYIILGLGYNYYLVNGLNLGIQFNLWLDGNPSVYQVAPEVNYVFYQVPKVKPYIGAFYRRNYIEGYDDLDAVGYRGGIYIVSGGGSYFGIGGVYSEYQDCNETVYSDCSTTYTEVTFMLSF